MKFKTSLLEYLDKNTTDFFGSSYSKEYVDTDTVRDLDSDAKDFFDDMAKLIGGKVELYSSDIDLQQRNVKIADEMEKMTKETGVVSMEFLQDFSTDGWTAKDPKTKIKFELQNGETVELNLGQYKMGTGKKAPKDFAGKVKKLMKTKVK